jgi:hypothetical protein
MAKTPQQIAAKWSRNLASAGQSIREGVEAVTESPMQKAAARKQAYLDGVQRAAAEGKWEAGLNRVSTAEWKAAFLDKGLTRIASGATAAEGKFGQFMAELQPHIESVKAALPPRGDTQQNIQRAVAMMTGMARFRRRS